MVEEKPVDFLAYWAEIRRRLLSVLVSFGVGVATGVVNYERIVKWLMQGFNLQNVNVVLTSPYQFFNVAVSISLACGIAVATPFLVYQLIQFVKPALRNKEYLLLVRLLPLSMFLFVAGFLFGGWVLQMVINIYSQTTKDFNIGNLWDIEGFLTQIVIMGISMSIVFQLPIVLTGLIKLKVLNRRQLEEKRRYVYAVLIIFDVLLPPTDILSMAIIFVPLLMLFEGTLLLNRE
ncbi:twin-arginine translocase subunit TatC [Candidatus Shapirobacteria bacterium]|nr:twin-arginine translocase subunit TatC [Candidatus Shapirobacteria bacterium]